MRHSIIITLKPRQLIRCRHIILILQVLKRNLIKWTSQKIVVSLNHLTNITFSILFWYILGCPFMMNKYWLLHQFSNFIIEIRIQIWWKLIFNRILIKIIRRIQKLLNLILDWNEILMMHCFQRWDKLIHYVCNDPAVLYLYSWIGYIVYVLNQEVFPALRSDVRFLRIAFDITL